MQRSQFGAFAKLELQPFRFSAPIKIKDLYRQAGGLVTRPAEQRAIVKAYVGIDLDLLTVTEGEEQATRVELVDYAIRVALQFAVEGGELQLFIQSAMAGRFLALPRNTLAAPQWFIRELGGQALPERLRYVPVHTWADGALHKNEVTPDMAELAEAGFPIFTTTNSMKATLAKIATVVGGARRNDGPEVRGPAPEEHPVVVSLHALVAESGGHLPQEKTVTELQKLHPDLTRNQGRKIFKQVIGTQRPGPVGPRGS